MTVTFTSASERDLQRTSERVRHVGLPHAILGLTSVVAIIAIVLAYTGRMRASGVADGSAQGVTNLNAVRDARELAAPMGRVFAHAADREFAAAHLLEFLRGVRDESRRLPNVGAIALATVPVEIVERADVVDYRDRLQRARQRAESAGSTPAVLPLFTSDDLSLLKPALTVRTADEFGALTRWWATLYLLSIWIVALLWWYRGVSGDYLLLSSAHLLTAIGFAAVLSRSDPLRDTVLFIRYTQGIALGCAACAVVSLLNFRRTALAAFSYLPLVGALTLSALLILFGSGPAGSNAKVNLGPVQPVEAIRLLIGLFLAGYFARHWEILRQVRGRSIRNVRLPAWLHVPRVEYVLPVALGVAGALLFFFLQKDLGPALFVSCAFLVTYALARGRTGLAIAGLMMLAAGIYVGFVLNISTTLSARVHMWGSAWDNAARGGDQIAQAIWALSTGGLFGTGLGLGDTRYVPAGHTDLALAAVGEELGFVGLVAVGSVFALIAARGFRTALRAANDYAFFLATIVTLFLVLPVVIMTAGTLGVIPLTGVVTPFLSYGGSAMVANFAALGVLAAIQRSASPAVPLCAPFRRGIRTLAAVLGIVAVALVGVLLSVQVIHADAYAVKPHLGLQADGVRRYQYNQRVLDVAASLPRGTIYDRTGLPLATSDSEVARRAATEYQKRRIDAACHVPVAERCYPLGGAAFHLVGDVSSRRNWSASNTSYVERDLQDRLRGFDDHAVTVRSMDNAGRVVPVVRREFGDLLPLLRHRHRPDHPDVRAFLARQRDITLAVDATLQARVAKILAKYAARSASGRAAAVVIDADSGDLLASVSYPFPGAADGPTDAGENAEEVVLDRARYGLYPPGSTFKLVTAAAALRVDAANHDVKFTCHHQPPSRVGARIAGYGVVRDDVLDTQPHGRIGLRDGLVRSCNAYFAQLAVRVGARPLADTAALIGVSVSRDDSVARLRATLPHAAYGQGDVVATPLRMARVAAAVASNGVLRDPRLERSAKGAAQTHALLSPAAARLLAQDLRDAVLTGTGRSLREHPWRIAGKTGTAEVAGAPSHAWFVGFAPHGAATRRIAFAVIVENAGYGGRAAAPAAGEIVTAAAASGLMR